MIDPTYPIAFLTYRCNFHCHDCLVDTTKTKELPANTWADIINKDSAKGVILAGGEPTMYHEFSQLIQAINRDKEIILLTNGTFSPGLIRPLPKKVKIICTYHDGQIAGFTSEKIAGRLKKAQNLNHSLLCIYIPQDDPNYKVHEMVFKKYRFTIKPGKALEIYRKQPCYSSRGKRFKNLDAMLGDHKGTDITKYKSKRVIAKKNKEPVTASVASIPQRVKSLEQTVISILPQVDRLNVYLNNYTDSPAFLKDKKIIIARSQDHGDLGDAGKFFWCESVKGYHATIDDDLLYCDDYIDRLVDKIEKYDRRCAVGCLGSWFIEPIRSYFGSQKGIHTFNPSAKDTFVNRLGTGCLMYHTDTLRVSRSDFENGFMADVWFCILAKKQNIPLLVVGRDKQLLFPLPGGKINSLHKKYAPNPWLQTKRVQELSPWTILTYTPEMKSKYMTERKLGMLLRADTGGLANISKEIYDHIKPEKSLVITNIFKGTTEFPDYYNGPNVTVHEGIPSTAFLEKWLEGLNVVLALETPYNWELFRLCKQKGIKSILMVDYEWLKDPMPFKPDILWQPIPWYLKELLKENVPVQYIQMPVNRNRYKFKKRVIGKTFLCVFGRILSSSVSNREGHRQIYEAIKLVKNPAIRFIFRCHHKLPPIDDPRVTIDISTKENPEDNYDEGDMMLLPKTYSGMSLTMHEALSCGMPVICMPDMFPQNRFLPKEWMIPPLEKHPLMLSREIIRTVISPQQIADMIDKYAMKDISKESAKANSLASSISWQRMKPHYENLLSPQPKAHSIEITESHKKLRIVFVGHVRSPWATEKYLGDALSQLGHKVIGLHGAENFADDIYRKSQGSDLMIYSPKWPIRKRGEKTGLWLLGKLRESNILSVSYHQDAHLFLKGRDERVNRNNFFWACDYVFTADGGHQAEFERRHINHFHLSPGAPESECTFGSPQYKYQSDIAFVGTCSGGFHDQWPFRTKLLEWLAFTYKDRFKKWGPRSGNRPEQIRNKELNDLYASVKIIIGDGRIIDDITINPGLYWSNRIVEVPGRGGFLIYPYITGIEAFLTPGIHFVSYNHQNGNLDSFAELKKIIDYYLIHDEEREAIRANGHQHIKNHHTYRHRAAYMLDTINRDLIKQGKKGILS